MGLGRSFYLVKLPFMDCLSSALEKNTNCLNEISSLFSSPLPSSLFFFPLCPHLYKFMGTRYVKIDLFIQDSMQPLMTRRYTHPVKLGLLYPVVCSHSFVYSLYSFTHLFSEHLQSICVYQTLLSAMKETGLTYFITALESLTAQYSLVNW